MADVSVEFGAKDSGLAQTLKNVQAELAALDTQQKSASMSADEFQKSLSRTKQLEGLETKIQKMAASTNEVGAASADTAPKVDKLGREMADMGDKGDNAGSKVSLGFGSMLKAGAAFAAGMAAVNAAFAAVAGTIDEFGAALDLGGRLTDVSARTGILAGDVLVLERAFTNNGLSAEQMGTSVQKMQENIISAESGTGAAADAFKKLGLSISEIRAMSPDQQFEAIGKSIGNIQDPALKSSLAADIFGRSGKELIAVFNDFDGSIGTAKSELGGMVGVMNTSAATFDTISDNIAVARGKFMEFAAGILSNITPALEAITEGLKRINAAKIGSDLVNAFLGGTKAMEGFQSAVSAIKAGDMSGAFNLAFASIKLQVLQTSNEIINNFSAAFTTAGQVLQTIFSPEGATMKFISSAFKIAGNNAAIAIGEAMIAILPNMKMFDGMKANFEKNIEEIMGASYNNFRVIKSDASAALTEVANVMGQAPEAFQKNLAAINTEFLSTEKAAQDVATATAEIAANSENIKFKESAKDVQQIQESMGDLVQRQRESIRLETERAIAVGESAAKTIAQIEDEIALTNAKALGNEKEVERLTLKKQQEESEAKIAKLTEDLTEKLGGNTNEAARLANNLISAQNALANSKAPASTLTTELVGTSTQANTILGAVKAINQEKMDQSAEALKERLAESRQKLGELKDFIGDDLSRMNLADIMKKLGIEGSKLESDKERINAISQAVEAIAKADVADITPKFDDIRLNPKLDAIQDFVKNLTAPDATPIIADISGKVSDVNSSLNSVSSPDATPQINEERLKNSIDSAKQMLSGIGSDPISMALDATESIDNIRTELSKPIQMDLQNDAGGGVLADIKTIVDFIKIAVEKIEPKLPQQALAY